MIFNTRHSPGFSIVEALVAVGLLALATAGPLALASKAIQASTQSHDKVTAVYLAQEALEYVRSIRDSNALEKKDWMTGLSLCFSENGCTIDAYAPSDAAIRPCGNECPSMAFNRALKHYGYGTGSEWIPSTFVRSVRLTTVPSNQDEITVTVRVTWISRSISYSHETNQHLFNWHKKGQ